MQAFFPGGTWMPPGGTLGTLTQEAHQRAAAALTDWPEFRAASRDAPPARPFASALRGSAIRVIAEVKRASPSKGDIAPGLDAAAQAEAYAAGGAAAVSVLTEPTRFGGSLADLARVARTVTLPAIRKDFIVHPVQLWEARAQGASAALLIVRSLSPDALPHLMAAADDCGLATLVEVRDEAELERAIKAGATVIGVNNRNLETLVIDPATAPRIIPAIPAACVAVAESGMQSPEDVAAAAVAGADAILVGSSVSTSTDPAAQVRAFASLTRSPDARRP